MFKDFTGESSAGRINATIMIICGMLISISGCILAYIEVFSHSITGYGIVIVGAGIGLATSASVYLGYHKTQETKTEIEQIKKPAV